MNTSLYAEFSLATTFNSKDDAASVTLTGGKRTVDEIFPIHLVQSRITIEQQHKKAYNRFIEKDKKEGKPQIQICSVKQDIISAFLS